MAKEWRFLTNSVRPVWRIVRIRANIHEDLQVTLSIGVATWDGKADIGELLQAADKQLYRAKHAGRNCVA